MKEPDKSIYSGFYKAEQKHINEGEDLEHLKFDSKTGGVACNPIYNSTLETNVETRLQQRRKWFLIIVMTICCICFVVACL